MEGSAVNERRVKVTRRGFLKVGSFVLAAFAVGTRRRSAFAQAAKPRLNEEDPEAQKLGYKHDATKVDKKKSPTYKPGETCGNCQLFQGNPAKDEWAPCPIFPGKQVNVNGWCSSYMKKTT